MQDYQFSALLKLYLFGKKLQALINTHNIDELGQYVVLRLVSEKPHTVSDLAQTLSIKISAATSKIAEMEKAGLISRRAQGDKRAHAVVLTKKGKTVFETMRKNMFEQSAGYDLGLTKPEAQTLETLIDQIHLWRES